MNPEEYNIGWIGNVEQPVQLDELKLRLKLLLEAVQGRLDVPFDDPSLNAVAQVADWIQIERRFQLLTLGQLRSTLVKAQEVAAQVGGSLDDVSLESFPEIRAWRRMKGALLSVSDVLVLLKSAEGTLDAALQLPLRLELARKLVEENMRKDLQLGGQIVVGPNIYSREKAFGQVVSGGRDAGNIVKIGLFYGKAVLETSGIDLGLVRR